MSGETSNVSRRFCTTRWSVVLLAGRETTVESRAALENLCRTYWQPVCDFARRKGWREEDAKDMTQEFFASLLERKDFAGLDPSRGKFRTFLLTAFSHFLANQYDRARAQKRGGGQAVFSLDEMESDGSGGPLPSAGCAPDKAYDKQWALTIVETALRKLKEEMAGAGKQEQFAALKRFLTTNAGPGDYAGVAGKLGVEAASVAVLVHRLRQRYQELAREEVAQTVSSPVELEEEMRHLFDTLNQ